MLENIIEYDAVETDPFAECIRIIANDEIVVGRRCLALDAGVGVDTPDAQTSSTSAERCSKATAATSDVEYATRFLRDEGDAFGALYIAVPVSFCHCPAAV